jgi:hypothetical protein
MTHYPGSRMWCCVRSTQSSPVHSRLSSDWCALGKAGVGMRFLEIRRRANNVQGSVVSAMDKGLTGQPSAFFDTLPISLTMPKEDNTHDIASDQQSGREALPPHAVASRGHSALRRHLSRENRLAVARNAHGMRGCAHANPPHLLTRCHLQRVEPAARASTSPHQWLTDTCLSDLTSQGA